MQNIQNFYSTNNVDSFSLILFVHPLSHIYNIGHVNLNLQFIYYKTQLIIYAHTHYFG